MVHQSIRTTILTVLVLTVAALVASVTAEPAKASSPDQDLINMYGYADYIITEGTRSSVNITYRECVNDGTCEWAVRSISQGSSLSLTQLSALDGSLSVVMTGGTLGNLTLIQTDSLQDITRTDIEFKMLGGELANLRMLTVPSYLESRLENSYILMFGPLGDITLDLQTGRIGDLVPTEDMISVGMMTVLIGDEMSIDRMLTSGSNGRYDIILVRLLGGTVGYMSNDKSVVGVLTYEFESGSMDYFSIGANSEAGNNNLLSAMSTFYVQGDVTVRVDNSVTIRQAIIGAGILDTPSVLWNGDMPNSYSSKNIEIDAPGMAISPDTCFFTSNRTHSNVYFFSTYTVGGTLRTRSISTNYYSGSTQMSVYGEDGIWASATDMSIQVGHYLYLNTMLTIYSNSVFTVEPGGRLVTAGHMLLLGVLMNNGDVLNSGVIEKREGGDIQGFSVMGDGFVAYGINVNTTDGMIEVMASDDDTVILKTDGTVYIGPISALLKGGDRGVVITVPNTVYVSGSEFMIGLKELENGDYISGYELTTTGIDCNVLESLSIEVTVPCAVSSDMKCYVYHQGSDGTYQVMEVIDRSYGEIMFLASGLGEYYLSTVPPDGEVKSGLDENTLNICLAVIIVIVGAVVVYILLKKDRAQSRGPMTPSCTRRRHRCRTREGSQRPRSHGGCRIRWRICW